MSSSAHSLPPWLETWAVEDDEQGGVRAEGAPYDRGHGCFTNSVVITDSGHYTRRMADQYLIAAAPALVRALLIAEWNSGFFPDSSGCLNVTHSSGSVTVLPPFCPVCRERDGQHATPCAVDAALTAAGLPDQASRDEARAAIKRMT